MREAEIQKQIIDVLKLHNALVFRLNSGQRNNNVKLCPNGTPDILAILPTQTLWIEVKAPKGKLRPTQGEMHAQLQERGQRVIVARSVDDVIEAING